MSQTTADLVLEKLPNLKRQRNGSYRGPSPLRSNSDSDAFVFKPHPDGEHGTWYDHHDDVGGSLYDLAARLKIPIPESLPELSSKKIVYKDLAEYAKRHGVPTSVFVDAKWKMVKHHGRPALMFPTKTGPRYRFIDGCPDNKPKFWHQEGYQSCWYGLAHAVELAKQVGYLVLCNGEPSVVVAQHFGVPAACITGGGERRLPDDLLTQLKESYSGDVFVVLDADVKGNKAAPDLTQQLVDAGFTSRHLYLPLGHGGDLADFCALYEDQTIKQLPQLSSSSPGLSKKIESRSLWRLIPADEIIERPPIRWLLDGKIPEGGLSVLYGRSGSGKSFLTLMWALMIAQQRTVIYVAPEGSYQERLRAWQIHHNYDPLGQLFFFEQIVHLTDPDQLNTFIDLVLPSQPAMIVFDTLAWVMTGDENKQEDMQKLMEACLKIQETTGAAVLLVHHTNKAGTYRGSSVLHGAADAMMEVENDDGVIKLTSFKGKESGEFDTEYYRQLTITTRENEDGDPVTSCVLEATDKVVWTKDNKLSKAMRAILTALALPIFDKSGATSKQIMEITDIASSTVYNTLGTLKSLGYISQGDKGHPYYITAEGAARLSPLSKTTFGSPGSSPTVDSLHSHTTISSESERESGETKSGNGKGNGHRIHDDDPPPWWDN